MNVPPQNSSTSSTAYLEEMNSHDLNSDRFFKVLSEALEASTRKTSYDKSTDSWSYSEEQPDWAIRLRALDVLGKLLGLDQPGIGKRTGAIEKLASYLTNLEQEQLTKKGKSKKSRK